MGAMLRTHAGVCLPYYVDSSGELHFVFERKDPKFKSPFFDNGLNLFGGNYQKGKHDDLSPEDTLVREVKEEFWIIHEEDESYNELIGQKFLDHQDKETPFSELPYDTKTMERIRNVGRAIYLGAKHGADFITTIHKPLVKEEFSSAITVFLKELPSSEFGDIKDTINSLEGKITTDNMHYDSRTPIIIYGLINSKPEKFAWGYDQIMNYLIARDLLPFKQQTLPVIRPLSRDFLEINPMEYSSSIERTKKGVPTFRGFEQEGYTYHIAT